MLLFTSLAHTTLDLGLQETALYIALDCSGSMAYVASNGQTRLANLKTALTDFLERLQATSSGELDLRLVAWSLSVLSSIERRSADSGDYDEIITWLNARTVGTGTDFNVAVSQAAAFYSGSGDKTRMMLFLTDGGSEDVEHVAEAVATLAGISDLSIYAINIELSDTQYTEQLDNTAADGVPVASGGDPDALLTILTTSLLETVALVVPAVNLTLSRSYAPGYPQQAMLRDGTAHGMLGEGSLRARAELDGKRSWVVLIRCLPLSDWTAFQDFYYTTTRRGLYHMTWATRPSNAAATVRFSPAEPPTWSPIENTPGEFQLQCTILEA